VELVELVEDAVQRAAAAGALEVVLLRGLPNLGPVLADLDVALSAAGSTVWELALFATPSVLLAVAPNQEPIARAMGAAGAAVDAGDLADVTSDALAAALEHLVADPVRREAMAATSWAMVDGRGSKRVATDLRSELVHLRPVVPDDVDLLYAWINDPAAREAAFDPSPISRRAHDEWFAAGLADPARAHWVALDHAGRELGQMRVDLEETGVGRISVSVARERRGEGWASALIARASREAVAALGPSGLVSLRAEVRPENRRSASAFELADFDRAPDGTRGGVVHRTYTRTCHG
jgi:RimJ/RimL family protein N-acetyltransferase